MGKLYATTVTNAKPRERDYKLTDGAGLYLLIKANGRKLWRLNYTYLGKQRPLSFGVWPDVGLADARERRDEARRIITAGLDPSHEAKLAAAREMLSEIVPKAKHLAAITTAKKAGALMRAIEGYKGGWLIGRSKKEA